MKTERLQSKAPPSMCQLSIKEPVEGDEVQPSSTMARQPLVQSTAKAFTLTPTTTPAVTKSKDNPYSKRGIQKCHWCGEP